MARDIGDVRSEIALLAGRKEARIVPRNEVPCVWKPMTVTNPETGLQFTDISAWHFIARIADEGADIEEMTLENPRGDTGYVIKVQLEVTAPELYIKVQLKGGKIWGRSFHYSTE